MGKILGILKGEARVKVLCGSTAGFINRCAANGIAFRRMERTGDRELAFLVPDREIKRVKELGSRCGAQVTVERRRGIGFLFHNIKKRYALLAGLLFCVAAVWTASLFIWEIDVTGNETVPTSKILTALEEEGLSVGKLGLTVEPDRLKNAMLLKIGELGWIAVNINGSKAHVIVHERVPMPELVDGSIPTVIYAEKSGLITDMTVLSGKKTAEKGDTVMQGEVLVTGVMDSLSSGTRFVHAMAEVQARTWYEISAQMPLKYSIKTYTGEAIERKSVILGKKIINFYLNGGKVWAMCDKIQSSSTLTVPGGGILPITIVTDTYYQYNTEDTELTAEQASEQLQERLIGRLKEKIGDGQITSAEFETEVSGGAVTVTMRAECLEEIAGIRRLTEGELRAGAAENEAAAAE